MAEEKSASSFQDMLDIIFADRNKNYGAYRLRRDYTKYLGRAFAYGLLLIGLFFCLPYILKAVSAATEKEDRTSVV